MGINGAVGGMMAPALTTTGVGIKMLRSANDAQQLMAEKMLAINVSGNIAKAQTEAKGMFIDTYA